MAGLTIWGVRLKVRPLTSVGMRLTQVLGTAMYLGSVLIRPWSSICMTQHVFRPQHILWCKASYASASSVTALQSVRMQQRSIHMRGLCNCQ